MSVSMPHTIYNNIFCQLICRSMSVDTSLNMSTELSVHCGWSMHLSWYTYVIGYVGEYAHCQCIFHSVCQPRSTEMCLWTCQTHTVQYAMHSNRQVCVTTKAFAKLWYDTKCVSVWKGLVCQSVCQKNVICQKIQHVSIYILCQTFDTTCWSISFVSLCMDVPSQVGRHVSSYDWINLIVLATVYMSVHILKTYLGGLEKFGSLEVGFILSVFCWILSLKAQLQTTILQATEVRDNRTSRRNGEVLGPFPKRSWCIFGPHARPLASAQTSGDSALLLSIRLGI